MIAHARPVASGHAVVPLALEADQTVAALAVVVAVSLAEPEGVSRRSAPQVSEGDCQRQRHLDPRVAIHPPSVCAERRRGGGASPEGGVVVAISVAIEVAGGGSARFLPVHDPAGGC